jgi:hypothetical protein
MALLLVISIALNMVQVNKDIVKCQKNDFKDAGCSIYVKMNVPKKK